MMGAQPRGGDVYSSVIRTSTVSWRTTVVPAAWEHTRQTNSSVSWMQAAHIT